jgi:hypothetical protein
MMIKIVPRNMSTEPYTIGNVRAKPTPSNLIFNIISRSGAAEVLKDLEINMIVKGIPYISTKSEIKKATTIPCSFQEIFLRKDRGIRKEMNSRALMSTICHSPVITDPSIDPMK